jgi:hypothetical protein
MAKECWNCRKKLSFRDSFVLDNKPMCGNCLNLLDKPKTSNPQQTIKEDYKLKMVLGIILFVGGIGMSVVSYLSASSGETFVITYGAVIAGFYYFGVGYDRWARYTGRRPPK